MWEQLKRRSSYQALPTIESKKPIDIFRDLHHPIFQNIRIIHVLISNPSQIVNIDVPMTIFLVQFILSERIESSQFEFDSSSNNRHVK